MNDREIMNGNSQSNIYRATSNLNTAIENPKINMNSAVGVNIKDVDSNQPNSTNFSDNSPLNNQFNNEYSGLQTNNINNSFNFSQNMGYNANTSIPKSTNSFDNMDYSTQYVESPNYNYTENNNHFINSNETSFVPTGESSMYEPTLEGKKSPSAGIKTSRELKILFFIVFILFIFILLMPYIYDFFKKFQLVITTR